MMKKIDEILLMIQLLNEELVDVDLSKYPSGELEEFAEAIEAQIDELKSLRKEIISELNKRKAR
ncbi:hypothetical protein [Sulfolobus polyhedral virus 1]|uniref:Uncharacterized protein n=2 Tax=Alphaportoglobovirus TaxID=2169647 RepID=A0A1W6I149_SPV1|nr:hypothetical protein DT302_gp09 [Sulfolobus polyhedral virus 1]YP_010084259.1 hypothetical protein KM458_gp09 [Sulfolobus polyhedral virus 2]ARM37791.1 hypothetical protein [Sulfolobus polyhedral virus 1]AZI76008.1 hypothetical protein SPV2_gp09 [Sulfolobus polyhedral virus 2]